MSVDHGAHIQAFTFSSQDHGRLSIVRISKHSLLRLKITVGCLTSTHPSIHVETLKITVGCRLCAYPNIHPSPGTGTLKITVVSLASTNPSIRNKNLQACWTPWSTQETRGLWARPPVLTPVPVPVQAIHSRACLNLHHSNIQSTAKKSSCVNTF